MESVPSWLKAALSKRIDRISQHMHDNPVHRVTREKESLLFAGLKASLSGEQIQKFIEWEECMNFQVSKEKEEFYVRGLWDGFHLCTSLEESLRSIPEGEPNLDS